MVEVEKLPIEDLTGAPCLTDIWCSQDARSKLLEYQGTKENPRGVLFKKLCRFAQNGFAKYEGKKPKPIRHEWGGVFRIGHADLFRIIGFYEDDTRRNFIVLDAFIKRKNELSSAERKRIDAVAKIKKEKLWKRKT